MAADPNRKPTQPEEEEIEHYDDAVIGRAFKISAVALALLLVGGGGFYAYSKRKMAAPPPKITKLAAPVAQTFEKIDAPSVRFTDVTAESGITFKHNNGAGGEKLLPETFTSVVPVKVNPLPVPVPLP